VNIVVWLRSLGLGKYKRATGSEKIMRLALKDWADELRRCHRVSLGQASVAASE